MKTLWLIFLVITGLSCQQPAGTDATVTANTLASFTIEGMVCEMGCAATIEEELATLPGVVAADVQFEAEKADVKFDEKIVSAEEILARVAAVNDNLYKTSALKVSPLQPGETSSSYSKKENTKQDREVSANPIVFPDIFRFPGIF